MKNKVIIVAVLLTLVTISFSFTSTNKEPKTNAITEVKSQNEPIGGFVSEAKF